MINKFQHPCQADWSDEQKKQDRAILRPLAVLTGVVIGVGALSYGCMDGTDKTAILKQREAQAAPPPLTSEQEEYRKFFAKHGSPAPVEMAKAITAAKPHNRPVLASVAIAESGGDHTIRRTGYKNSHDGAFQVNPRWHGKVPSDAVGQALQTERILEELVGDEPRGQLQWKPILIRYNGGSSATGRAKSARYADRVIALAKQVRP